MTILGAFKKHGLCSMNVCLVVVSYIRAKFKIISSHTFKLHENSPPCQAPLLGHCVWQLHLCPPQHLHLYLLAFAQGCQCLVVVTITFMHLNGKLAHKSY